MTVQYFNFQSPAMLFKEPSEASAAPKVPAMRKEMNYFFCQLPSNQPKLQQENQQKEQPKSENLSAVAAELWFEYIYIFLSNLLESCTLALQT